MGDLMKKYKVQLDKMKQFIMPCLNKAKAWIAQLWFDSKEFIMPYLNKAEVWIAQLWFDNKDFICRIGVIIAIFGAIFLAIKLNSKLFLNLFGICMLCISFIMIIMLILNIIFWFVQHGKRLKAILTDLFNFIFMLFITLTLSNFISASIVIYYLQIDKQIDKEGFLAVLAIILIGIGIHTIISLISNYVFIKRLKENISIIIIECILKIITTVFFATIIGLNDSIGKYLFQFNIDLRNLALNSIFDFRDIFQICIYLFFPLFTCHSITFEAAKKINQKNMAG